MSQMYRVKIKESVTLSVNSSDRVIQDIGVRAILSAPEMSELLAKGFEKQGFVLQADGRYQRRIESGELQTFDPAQRQLVTELEQEVLQETELVSELTRDLDIHSKTEIEDLARAQLPQQQELKTQELQQQADSQLMQTLLQGDAARRETIHRALQHAYSEALKQRARSLGQVVSEQEHRNGSDFELTIRIEL